ncbi:Uncharacterised protein [Vibrio cholerae]|nr:Uncharacterised protein [Vibrio cholerae]
MMLGVNPLFQSFCVGCIPRVTRVITLNHQHIGSPCLATQ